MKKTISLLLSLLMLVSVFAVIPVAAADSSKAAAGDKVKDVTLNDVKYSLYDDGHAVIAKYTGHEKDLTIPATVEGYTVTSLGMLAFDDNWDVEILRLPDTVTNLGWRSIGECAIKSIYLGKGLKAISEDAFEYNTHLTDIYYSGTEAEWAKVTVAEGGNDRLKEVTMHYVQVINSVNIIGVTAPAVGQSPSVTGINYSGSGYSVTDAYYYDDYNKTKLMSTDTFKAGTRYCFTAILKAKDGYEFSSDGNNNTTVSSTVNGKQANSSRLNSSEDAKKRIMIRYYFDALSAEPQVVSEINITGIDFPVIGEYPKTEVDDNEAYTASVSWFNVSDRRKMEDGEKFEEGKQYSLFVYIYAKDGYKFDAENIYSVNCSITLNGVDYDAIYNVDMNTPLSDAIEVDWCFDPISDSAVKLDTVCVTRYTAPVKGEKPNFNITPIGDGFTVSRVEWYDCTDLNNETLISADTVFEVGHSYSIYIYVKPTDGYIFSKDLLLQLGNPTGGFYTYVVSGNERACKFTQLEVPEESTPIEHEHVWGDWTVTKNATPFEDGEEMRECLSDSSHTETRPIAMVSGVTIPKLKYNYTGKAIKPVVTVKDSNGKKLVNGTDYEVIYPSKPVNAGLYMIDVQLLGKYEGLESIEYNIIAVKNPITVNTSTKTVKLSKVKKANQTVKPIKVSKANGKVTFKLTSVPKALKKLVKINSKGAITISKWAKAKKGIYKIKVKITAKGNKNYNPKSLNKTVTIKMK